MGMDIVIHRGSHEIGGICIEVTCGDTRIVIDAGLPLMDRDGKPFKGAAAAYLPQVPGLFDDTAPPPTALLLTHAHMDHYGLLPYVREGVPIYGGQGTRTMIEVTRTFIRREYDPGRLTVVEPFKPFRIGDVTATPWLVDHSAFGAFAWQLDCGGRRMLYTGDLRAHGRKAKLFDRMLHRGPAGLDALLMEGTHIGEAFGACRTEDDVRDAFGAIAGRTPGTVVAFASGQNIDRIVSIFKAARHNHRKLLIDVYVAYVLYKLRAQGVLPQAWWNGVQVFFPRRLADSMNRRNLDSIRELFRPYAVDPADQMENPGGYLVIGRPSMADDLAAMNLDGAAFAWSMWSGYLNDPSADALRALAASRGIKIQTIHASGHAYRDDLQRLARALAPKRVVPIHTMTPDLFRDLFDNVVTLDDGERLDL